MTNFFDKIMFKKLIKMHDKVKDRENDILRLKQDIARLHRLLKESTQNLETARDLLVKDIDPREALSAQAFMSLRFKFNTSIADSYRHLGLK